MPGGRAVRMAALTLACVLVAALTSGCQTKNSAAQTAARTYVGYIASAATPDLEKLWSLTATDDPAAIRAAGELLATASDRIDIVDVGDPQSTQEPEDVANAVSVDNTYVDFERVPVVYKLRGTRYRGAVVVAHPQAQSGRDVASWRVIQPLTGSIGWQRPGFADLVTADVYLGGIRIVRRPGNDNADVQPLYPAVYRYQERMDPYYASPAVSLSVPATSVLPPKLTLKPTKTTRTLIIKQVWAQFAACDTEIDECPVYELVVRQDPSIGEPGWWLGLTRKPKLAVGDDGTITLAGGAFRYRNDHGTQVVRFNGTAKYLLDSETWKPTAYHFQLERS